MSTLLLAARAVAQPADVPQAAAAPEAPRPLDPSPYAVAPEPEGPVKTRPEPGCQVNTRPEPRALDPSPYAEAPTAGWPKAPPAPYSLPWELRGVTPANVIRSDNSFARYEDANAKGGLSIVNMLSAGYVVRPHLGVVAKLTTSEDSPPTGRGGFVMDNPVVGAVYGLSEGNLRAAFALSATVPVGGGGGDHPTSGSLDARKAGVPPRLAMDNSVFAPNDFTVIPGVDFAWVAHGFTVQVEATYFELHRVRGKVAQAEATKRNFTEGLHVGWFVLPNVSIGGELRYQHWLDPPFFTKGNDRQSNAGVDQASFAFGPRFHVKLGDHYWLRPGIAYARGLDLPLGGARLNYHVVQLDIPFTF